MPASDVHADHDGGRGLRTVWRLVKLAVLLAVCGVLAVAAGFGLFLSNVPAQEVRLERNADGIVVLTGGASRIDDAIELLASGHGRRLLISGVHPQTSEREIARLKPEYRKTVLCCVDLDRSAVNTIGNATETRRWAHERGFRSLIVVTSNYHMPRAMAELSHQLPDIELIPFPVIAEQLRASWSSGPNLRLLFLEYVKYTVAVTRMWLPFELPRSFFFPANP
jgi:uncharacterized SAM-binding protein YcdF (DUF218 family)